MWFSSLLISTSIAVAVILNTQHLLITLKKRSSLDPTNSSSKDNRLTLVPYEIERKQNKASKRILNLSHISMVLMLIAILNMSLAYCYPVSGYICNIYWKTACISYNGGIYSIKWMYLIRAYSIYQTIDENHRVCRFIKILFLFQLSLCFGVIYILFNTLRADDINYNENCNESCKLRFELSTVSIPMLLIVTDIILLTLFANDAFEIVRLSENNGMTHFRPVIVQKLAIWYHYLLTLLCLIIPCIDYVINMYYMGTVTAIIMVIIDCLCITICIYLIVNDKSEQIASTFMHQKVTGIQQQDVINPSGTNHVENDEDENDMSEHTISVNINVSHYSVH